MRIKVLSSKGAKTMLVRGLFYPLVVYCVRVLKELMQMRSKVDLVQLILASVNKIVLESYHEERL